MDAPDRLSAHIRANAVKSALLIAGFPFVIPTVVFFFLLFAGMMFGQRSAGAVAAQAFFVLSVATVVIALVWLPIGYLMNQWIIDKATGARLLGRHEEPRLWAIFENLCAKCGMRLPALRIIESDVMNAFASGLSEGRYSVTVTRGLLDELNEDEIEAVLAHELTHIRNHDVRLLVVATVLVGMVPIVHDVVVRAFWLLVMGILNIYRAMFSLLRDGMTKMMVEIVYTALFLAGKAVAFGIGAVGQLFSLVIHFALSRKREFMADAGAVEMTGKPEALISALRRISCNSGMATNVEGVKAMLFDSPAVFGMGGLFATHPPVEARIEALIKNASSLRQATRDQTKADAEPRREPSIPTPSRADPDMVEGFRAMLLRAMGGKAEAMAADRREHIYERARKALAGRMNSDSPMPEREAAVAAASLAEAIGQIERGAGAAGRQERRPPPVLRAQR